MNNFEMAFSTEASCDHRGLRRGRQEDQRQRKSGDAESRGQETLEDGGCGRELRSAGHPKRELEEARKQMIPVPLYRECGRTYIFI